MSQVTEHSIQLNKEREGVYLARNWEPRRTYKDSRVNAVTVTTKRDPHNLEAVQFLLHVDMDKIEDSDSLRALANDMFSFAKSTNGQIQVRIFSTKSGESRTIKLSADE